MPSVGPAENAVLERHRIGKTQPQQRFGGECGSTAAQAIEHHGPRAMRERLGGLVIHGRVAVDFEFEQAARNVNGPWNVALGELLGLAHIHDRATELLQFLQLGRPDLADDPLRGSNEVTD